MPALNIRNVDVTLVTRLKQEALTRGMTLRGYCLAKLEASDDRDPKRNDLGGVDGANSGRTVSGSGNRARLPVLRKAKSDTKLIHPVQPLREKLDERDGHIQSSAHEAHRTFLAGGRRYCSDCKSYY